MTQRQGTLNPFIYVCEGTMVQVLRGRVFSREESRVVVVAGGGGGGGGWWQGRKVKKRQWRQSDYLQVLGFIPLMKSLWITISRGRFMDKRLNLISFLRSISTNVSLGSWQVPLLLLILLPFYIIYRERERERERERDFIIIIIFFCLILRLYMYI